MTSYVFAPICYKFCIHYPCEKDKSHEISFISQLFLLDSNKIKWTTKGFFILSYVV